MAGVVYHWKHGWIPLTHAAALSKAKGNHELAARYAADAHHANGIQTRQDLAKAITDLPNVGQAERAAAHTATIDAATRLNAHDLLPRSMQLDAAARAKRAEADRIAGMAGAGDRAAGRLSPRGLAQFHRNTDSQLRRHAEATGQAEALAHKAALARSRENEAARVRLTHDQIKGATHVRDQYGWHEVVRVNGKTVTVKTPHSWTDTIPHDKIHDVRKFTAADLQKVIDSPTAAPAAKQRARELLGKMTG